MKGWVGLVVWPTADVWPTKWSSVQLAVRRKSDRESSPVKDSAFYHCVTPPTQLRRQLSYAVISSKQCKVIIVNIIHVNTVSAYDLHCLLSTYKDHGQYDWLASQKLKPGFHYPSWRAELTGDQFPLPLNTGCVDRHAFPLAELTGNGNRSPVKSGSGNRALVAAPNIAISVLSTAEETCLIPSTNCRTCLRRLIGFSDKFLVYCSFVIQQSSEILIHNAASRSEQVGECAEFNIPLDNSGGFRNRWSTASRVAHKTLTKLTIVTSHLRDNNKYEDTVKLAAAAAHRIYHTGLSVKYIWAVTISQHKV